MLHAGERFPGDSQNPLFSISAGFGVGFKHFRNRL
jgi:hypothetical protein